MQSSSSLENPFSSRRQKLISHMAHIPAVIFAGTAPARNYSANPYPFRASSHFLYFTGLTQIPGAVLVINPGKSSLFVEPVSAEDEVWHGPQPSFAELKQQSGVDEIRPLLELPSFLNQISKYGQLPLPSSPSSLDEQLAEAVISLRLQHDQAAVIEMRRGAEITKKAHLAGMAITKPGILESVIRSTMEQIFQAANFTTAYGSIVTVHGEVLHSHAYHHLCHDGDLLLADVGAETDTGWASDVTRTWPVNGRFSATQKQIYEIVLAAQKHAISMVKPGVRYRDIHFAACRILTQGLCDEGILQGQLDGLIERGAHALFFPHGVGHLIGLDVHDMEDLKEERSGYAKGRTRSTQFGTKYLRLDRDLLPGMAVTIEPGIYFIKALWKNAPIASPFQKDIHWDRVEKFSDVRGIRIEDDVLVTETGCEVLTKGIPKEIVEIETSIGVSYQNK